MGNFNMTVVGIGCHHNENNPADADAMFKTFVGQLRQGGHDICHASITYGGAEICSACERITGPDIFIPAIGAAFGGGFFAGEMIVGGQRYALVVAPKVGGEEAKLQYKTTNNHDGADSDDDGLANSERLNDTGHPAAQFCRSLQISGFDDWYLPSRDELAMLCRNLGPTRKTTPALFKSGNTDAFEEDWYWSSTEHASYSDGAWYVDFSYGGQNYGYKDNFGGVRAVRRLKI